MHVGDNFMSAIRFTVHIRGLALFDTNSNELQTAIYTDYKPELVNACPSVPTTGAAFPMHANKLGTSAQLVRD